jgi:Fic family protein
LNNGAQIMKRGSTGRYEVTAVGGESVRAFVPRPLPPSPPLALDAEIQPLLERALLALGRLDGVSTLLPDPALFLYSYVRKEAVLSSQIEGSQSSLSDLLLFELDQAPGVPLDDVVEVSNYVAALDHGLARLRDGFPLSARLIREIHAVLMARGRGSTKQPGEFRRSQNWLGGSRPGNAVFVPPPHNAVVECIADFERFLHGEGDGLPVVVKAALAHVQFETIHPFLDGNGRVGRLLITLHLCDAGILREPLLYLSLFFKEHRAEYYRLLDAVRADGDWEAWVGFFLQGVAETADGAVATARQLVMLFEADRERLRGEGRRAGSALRIHDALTKRPLIRLQDAVRRADLSFPTAATGMGRLVELGIAREVTGRKRNRVFAYDRYLALLSEGTER